MNKSPDPNRSQPRQTANDQANNAVGAEAAADVETLLHAAANMTAESSVEADIGEQTNARQPTLEETILTLRRQLEETNNKLLRTMAEFDNYRKRMIKESTETRQMAKVGVIREILPIMDQFQMAMDASATSPDLRTLQAGIQMTLAEFDRCFQTLGMEKVLTQGQRFDPSQHEAVSTEPSATVAEEYIVREWKRGYKVGDRLIRPAAVVVSAGPSSPVK